MSELRRGPDSDRPGPDSIEPGKRPGGLVVRVYSVPDGVLLSESAVGLDDVEGVAERDAKYVEELWRGSAVPDHWLVFYDGDSGQRLVPPPDVAP